MEWRDTGILLSVRPHGETSVIAEVFSAEHGRHAGVIRGGISRKLKPVLQPGAQLSVVWQARLESHLGSFRVEPTQSRTADLMEARVCLEAANSIFALLSRCLAEREAAPYLYAKTVAVLDHIEDDPGWLADYVRWEIVLLREVGFGLDLESCAATGVRDNLIYVSPKSGRAVSAQAGAPYSDRLLKLPGFLLNRDARILSGDLCTGMRLSGYFLEHSVMPTHGKTDLPAARGRLLDLMEKRDRGAVRSLD